MTSNNRILGLGLAPRVALALVLLWAGAAVVAMQLMPHKPLMQSWLQLTLGAGAVLLCLVAAAVASLTLMQWILRRGGTDTQWLWFASEPDGLVRQRR